MKNKLLSLFLAFALSAEVFSQTQGTKLLQSATDAFEMGRFEQLDTLLTGKLGILSEQERIQGLRLLALSAIQKGDMQAAENYTTMILKIDPAYVPYGDTPRFMEIVSKLKNTEQTLTTASKIAESIDETPIPVTVITADMIKASGATKLSDVLLLYVPGMSEISAYQDNIAMRGIYGIGQENILVMVDGIRINSMGTNAASLDYSNSIDKIKQIEVLRGPASSLYGNVALTAVINIITKTFGDDRQGEASLISGSNNDRGAFYLFNGGTMQSRNTFWSSLFTSDGEPAGKLYNVFTEKYPLTTDIGIEMYHGKFRFSMLYNYNYKSAYNNLILLGDYYTYSKYPRSQGIKPGTETSKITLSIDYNTTLGNWSLYSNVYSGVENYIMYNAMGDEVYNFILNGGTFDDDYRLDVVNGIFGIMTYDGNTYGASASGVYQYEDILGMNGTFMLGCQYENFKCYSSSWQYSMDYSAFSQEYLSDYFSVEPEYMFSGYMQLKNYFTPKLIFNGGIRYDYKIRIDGNAIKNISPRAALIWRPLDILAIKGSYAHSFEDSPWFMRAAQKSVLKHGRTNPEQIDSYQASINLGWPYLNIELNTFRNVVKDLVYFNAATTVYDDANETAFQNAGNVTISGIEQVLQYSKGNFFANLNMTYQMPYNIEDLPCQNDTLCNIPHFILNATVSNRFPYGDKGYSFALRANLRHVGAGLNLENNVYSKLIDPDYFVANRRDAYNVLGFGVEWNTPKHWSFSIDCYNLLNTKYYKAGMLALEEPGLGRRLMFKLRYGF